MKTLKPAVLVIVVSVLTVAGVVAAAAATGTNTTTVVRARGGGGAFLGRWIDDPQVQEELALTPDQITRLKALRDDSRASIRDLRAATIRARADLRATLLDTKAARQDIEKKAAAVRDATSAVSKEVTKRLLDARDILTVDQREKLITLIQDRAGAVRGRFFRGRRGFHGPIVDGSIGDDTSDDAPEVN